MHDAVIVGIPLLAIFAGILFNRADVKELRAEMTRQHDSLDRKLEKQGSDLRSEIAKHGSDLRAEMGRQYLEVLNRFNSLDRAMNEFYHMTGRLDARMDALEKE